MAGTFHPIHLKAPTKVLFVKEKLLLKKKLAIHNNDRDFWKLAARFLIEGILLMFWNSKRKLPDYWVKKICDGARDHKLTMEETNAEGGGGVSPTEVKAGDTFQQSN